MNNDLLGLIPVVAAIVTILVMIVLAHRRRS